MLSVSSLAQAHSDHSTIVSVVHHWFSAHHGALGFVALASIAAVLAYKKLNKKLSLKLIKEAKQVK